MKRKRNVCISYITDTYRDWDSTAQDLFTSLEAWRNQPPQYYDNLLMPGTLSNLPAGLKARGLRIKGDDAPLMPGKFRDVDVPVVQYATRITFIPYKEPSSVLYSLLGNIVEEGRRMRLSSRYSGR